VPAGVAEPLPDPPPPVFPPPVDPPLEPEQLEIAPITTISRIKCKSSFRRRTRAQGDISRPHKSGTDCHTFGGRPFGPIPFGVPIDAVPPLPVAIDTIMFPVEPELTVVLAGLNVQTVLLGRVPQP
jgi:hypothetical protein